MAIPGKTTFISRETNVTRRCFDLATNDDDLLEPPEKLGMVGTPISHLIEFNPFDTTIWIIDDDSKIQITKIVAISTLSNSHVHTLYLSQTISFSFTQVFYSRFLMCRCLTAHRKLFRRRSQSRVPLHRTVREWLS